MHTAVVRIDRNDLISTAEHQLAAEFITAFSESPRATVSTPEWRTARSTVAEVIACDLSDDGEDLHQLLQIVAHGANNIDVTLLCQAWRDKVAQRYAKAQAPDVAREMADHLRDRSWA